MSAHFTVMGFTTYTNLLLVSVILFGFCSELSTTLNILYSSQSIGDHETISSVDGSFKLGFFSPQSSTNRYVGIWFLSPSNVVWVANKDNPLRDSSGIVTISEDGNLVVLSGRRQPVWSSNVSNIAFNSTAKLLNSGNLVLVDNARGEMVWESFQHPSHALISKMALITNEKTGKKVKLTSWKSPSDASDGNFSYSIERLRAPEMIVWNQRKPHWRSGPWNGKVFIGNPHMQKMYRSGVNVGMDDETVHVNVTFSNDSFFIMIVLDSQGTLTKTNWVDKKETLKYTVQDSDCDIYGFCGAFGSCNRGDSPICSCLRGFEPRNIGEWNRKNWTGGCMRIATLECERKKNGSEAGKEDGFLTLQNTKVPDFTEQSFVEKSSSSEDSCKMQCLKNCSCLAYAYDAGIRCMSWHGQLIDIQRFSNAGVDLYIRVANSELDHRGGRQVKKIIILSVIAGATIISACAYFLWAWTCKRSGGTHPQNMNVNMIENLGQVKFEELPLFDFRNLATATNNFTLDNKLGEGGFGPVYKGELQDGQKIAVKRLSRASGQGLEEFMNEVIVISKLQHRNLVKILGCCIEGEEKMLIYEFMPNKSLDAFLFDPFKKKDLDWQKRLNIIQGISRGLFYLHRDSRLRIIHRDMKTSNILLDEELNPKISDFGMARIFGGCEDQANTKRVVGTYGYMSPEYAMQGLFSEKSDVFSFGVLMLEIVSGSRNTSFYGDKEPLTLLGLAWKLWNEGNIIDIIDPEISHQGYREDILRCIHIGLLCVQEVARERPTMATVVSMLNSEIAKLAAPGQPAFVQSHIMLNSQSSQESRSQSLCSNNMVTVTNIIGR